MPLRDYRLIEPWVNTGESGTGNGKFIIGIKSGVRYFIKELDFFVRRGSEFPRAQRDIDNPIFEQTIKKHLKMKSLLASIGVAPNDRISVPVEVTTKPFLKNSETIVLINHFVEDKFLPNSKDDVRIKSIAELSITQKHALFVSAITNLEKIHRVKIIHSDLKPGNILVCQKTGKFFTHLIDFDAFFFEGQPPQAVTMSIGYETPEAIYYNEKIDGIKPEHLTTKLDIFNLAIIIHEYFTGMKPNVGEEPNVAMAVIRNHPVKLDPLLAKTKIQGNDKLSYASLLNWMLEFNYEKRPSALQVLNVLLGKSSDIPVDYLTKSDAEMVYKFDRLYDEHQSLFKFVEEEKIKKQGISAITQAKNLTHYQVIQHGKSKILSLQELLKQGLVVRYASPSLPDIPHYRFLSKEALESKGVFHVAKHEKNQIYIVYYFDKKPFTANKDTLFYSLNLIEKIATPIRSEGKSPSATEAKTFDLCNPFPEHRIRFNTEKIRKANIYKITRNDKDKNYFIYFNTEEKPKVWRLETMRIWGIIDNE
jgi:serine/threonine protein kinase